MKYRIILLIIIIISLGQILLSYIANTHAHMHTRAHASTHTRADTHRRRRRRRRHSLTGHRYSVAPSRERPLRLRQCRSLAIQMNTRQHDTISPRFLMFFAYKKMLGRIETRTRDRIYCQTIRIVRDISRDD